MNDCTNCCENTTENLPIVDEILLERINRYIGAVRENGDKISSYEFTITLRKYGNSTPLVITDSYNRSEGR